MSVYNWEQSAHAGHKKAKKTGMVVLHKDEGVDTSFARLLKPIAMERAGNNAVVSAEAAEDRTRITIKTPLMTTATVQALETKMGFAALLPCQAQCYRGIFNGRDVVLHSRTGSGKTLAYALPIIERHILLESGTHPLVKEATIGNDEEEEDIHSAVVPVEDNNTTPAVSQSVREGPFLVIFVFSNELAVQTRDVLRTIYPAMRIFVAGVDTMPHANIKDESHSEDTVVDILIGTVAHMDRALRGKTSESYSKNEEEEEEGDEDEESDSSSEEEEEDEGEEMAAEKTRSARKRPRPVTTKSTATNANKRKNTNKASGEATDTPTNSATDDTQALLSAKDIRAVVIDEVDTTLGPRFTNVGRRMKNLLKFIRKANGSLTEGLLHDYRKHHYVLCGATIPNWVIKAGFLGVKKYYYELVAVGTEKLPATLDCLELVCPREERAARAAALLRAHATFFGRVIVFGTERQLSRLEQILQTENSNDNNKEKRSGALIVRTVMGSRPESARMAAIAAYNAREANVLLCTDLAARGLHFVAVDTVIMLALPASHMATETFVHRAGRTARVGRPGRCLVLHDETERDVMDGIAKAAHVVFRPFRLATQEATGNEATKAKSKDGEKATTTTTTGQADVVSFALTVRNPFRFTATTNKVSQVPSAKAVLEKQLSPALRAALVNVREKPASHGEVVEFAIALAHATELRSALWKYDLKELPKASK